MTDPVNEKVAPPPHVVKVEFDQGWPSTTMVCPFDPKDENRPCRPYDESGEPSVPGDFCNWSEWYGEGGLDCVEAGPVFEMAVTKATWDDDCFRFDLGHIGRSDG